MTKEQKNIEISLDEMKRLAEKESELENQCELAIQSLIALRALGSEGTIKARVAKIREAQVTVELLEEEIAMVREQRRSAIERFHAAKAAALRAKAAGLREESAALRLQALPLLDRLSQLMDVPYNMAILMASRNEHFVPLMTDIAEDPELCAPGVGMISNTGVAGQAGYLVPKFAALIFQARLVDQQAGALEGATVCDGGEIAGNGFEMLLERLAEISRRPETITPSIASVRRWASQIESQVRKHSPVLAEMRGPLPEQRKLRNFTGQRIYTLTWRGGSIDYSLSSLSITGDHEQSTEPFQVEGPWGASEMTDPWYTAASPIPGRNAEGSLVR